MKLSSTEIIFLYCSAAFAAWTLGRLVSLYQEEHPSYSPPTHYHKPNPPQKAVMHIHGDNVHVGYPFGWEPVDGFDVVNDDAIPLPPTDKTGCFYFDKRFNVWVPEGTAIGYQINTAITGNQNIGIDNAQNPIKP